MGNNEGIKARSRHIIQMGRNFVANRRQANESDPDVETASRLIVQMFDQVDAFAEERNISNIKPAGSYFRSHFKLNGDDTELVVLLVHTPGDHTPGRVVFRSDDEKTNFRFTVDSAGHARRNEGSQRLPITEDDLEILKRAKETNTNYIAAERIAGEIFQHYHEDHFARLWCYKPLVDDPQEVIYRLPIETFDSSSGPDGTCMIRLERDSSDKMNQFTLWYDSFSGSHDDEPGSHHQRAITLRSLDDAYDGSLQRFDNRVYDYLVRDGDLIYINPNHIQDTITSTDIEVLHQVNDFIGGLTTTGE